VVTTDTEGRVTYWNKAAEDPTADGRRILGKASLTSWSEGRKRRQDLPQALAEGRAWSGSSLS
jgi:hypothetical protein